MHKVRVGVIGCGSIAHRAHLPWYWENPHAELLAVCDEVKPLAEKAAERWQARKVFTDYRKLLKLKELDAVSICTPVWTHHEIAVSSAQAGKHILCEKPMARNMVEADAMVQAAQKAGVKLMVGFMKRFSPGFLKMKEMIDQRMIGRVYHTDIHWNLYFPPGSHPSKIFSEDRRIGGGVILDNCSHYIDLFRWLLTSDVDTVFAEISKVIPERIYEDQVTIVLRFKNKATSILDMGFNRVEGVEKTAWDKKHMGYAYQFSELGYIYGTEGTIMFNVPPFESVEAVDIKAYLVKGKHCKITGWHEIEIPVVRQPGGPQAPCEVISYPFKAEIDHFINCILNNKPLSVSGEDGRVVVAITEAAYDSARSGKKEKVMVL